MISNTTDMIYSIERVDKNQTVNKTSFDDYFLLLFFSPCFIYPIFLPKTFITLDINKLEKWKILSKNITNSATNPKLCNCCECVFAEWSFRSFWNTICVVCYAYKNCVLSKRSFYYNSLVNNLLRNNYNYKW